MRDDTVTIEDLILLHSTDKAYLVQDLDNEEYWIPKSQVFNIEFGKDIEIDGKPAKEIREMEIPEWLAEDKGLI